MALELKSKWVGFGICKAGEQKLITTDEQSLKLKPGSVLISAWAAEYENGKPNMGNAVFYTQSSCNNADGTRFRVKFSHDYGSDLKCGVHFAYLEG
jgi:hypothetical protein